ncbi:MAG: aminoacetone oxidase family FAD-binding enzyme [Candidatus Pacebacteria bacterium]|nr:aminoacetone oxidase family FAD-binding enzyme [Candidatus Paceibacterota bacterium]
MKDIVYDVIVIGGGASGMMASLVAGEKGKKVLLLEKNKNLGEKLKISGGGRCNITNAEEDIHKFLKFYEDSEDFLYSPFSQFKNTDTFTFFEQKNLPLVTQIRKRVFPETERALDVFNVLKKYMDKGKVEVKSNSPVLKILSEGKKIVAVVTKQGTFYAKSFILATGGVSHPETGSTGDGFKWLKDLGHTVKEPTPTIVPLRTKDHWVHVLKGVSLKNVKINFYLDDKKQFGSKGDILCTHFGLSGPLILNSAKKVADLLHSGIVKALIDAYPSIDTGELEKKIIKIFDSNKNKILKNIVNEFAPIGTLNGLQVLFKDIDFNKKVHSITKEERKSIAQGLKALPVIIEGLMGYDRAVVADGGVILTEIDTKTMCSKLYENLYITGDLLHITRPTGGFSLQLCWTTGYVAGMHV